MTNSRYFHLLTVILVTVMALFSLSAQADTYSEKATVLIVMQPFKQTGKPWDAGKGADPIICLNHGCYVGRGYLTKAKYFPGKKAYLPAVMARACNNTLTCVYRGVKFTRKREDIWPVDIDGFKRDYMATKKASVDRSCFIENKRLQCLNGIYTPEYSMWVIPEDLAKDAGRKVLDYALYKGIHDAREEYMADYLERQRAYLPKTVARFYEKILKSPVPTHCAVDPDIISEAFYLAGIFNSDKRKSGIVFKHLISEERFAGMRRTMLTKPARFWVFHDALSTLELYAFADKRQEFSYQRGLIYKDNNNRTSLLIGWDVKSRAKKVMDQCISGKSYSLKG